ncbi:SDR family oxidoreductase [Stutzerimonas urumqiensis]|uniref:dTDP-4-dehydrorhamnose reductase family protein n=1 Tax=Stutzerimonas urumqiensis TaxID=638269 RepID=UPI003DA45698
MRVLVLGVTGMLGHDVYSVLDASPELDVWGTLRSSAGLSHFSEKQHERMLSSVDVLDQDALTAALARIRPDVVINCVGLIKQLSDADDPLVALPINALLPHRLAQLCALGGARLIHISTDCVFSGSKGLYVESDVSDAEDLYGKSKYIGELHKQPNAVTLRTSIIGHELGSNHALLEWFLSQRGSVKGYRKAIFSGLPTVELARVIRDFVIPSRQLQGLYHVSVDPIDKYNLLKLVAEIYGKDIEIVPDDNLKIDRSLDSALFRNTSGYTPPTWRELIEKMRDQR